MKSKIINGFRHPKTGIIMNRIEYIQEKLIKHGIPFDPESCGKLLRFYELLVKWNERMNLTAITDFEEAVMKHFVDSLAILIPEKEKIIICGGVDQKILRLIDVGAGAGFPGLPIAIMKENWKVVLLETLKKRTVFLNEVVKELRLSNVEVVWGRAEEFGQKTEYRECFDIAVSRAVASLPVLSEFCIPFVKVNGRFIAYKGSSVKDEIEISRKAVKMLGAEIKDSFKYEFSVETEINSHSLVIIEKMKKTEKKYPRKAGIPGKNPLGVS